MFKSVRPRSVIDQVDGLVFVTGNSEFAALTPKGLCEERVQVIVSIRNLSSNSTAQDPAEPFVIYSDDNLLENGIRSIHKIMVVVPRLQLVRLQRYTSNHEQVLWDDSLVGL